MAKWVKVILSHSSRAMRKKLYTIQFNDHTNLYVVNSRITLLSSWRCVKMGWTVLTIFSKAILLELWLMRCQVPIALKLWLHTKLLGENDNVENWAPKNRKRSSFLNVLIIISYTSTRFTFTHFSHSVRSASLSSHAFLTSFSLFTTLISSHVRLSLSCILRGYEFTFENYMSCMYTRCTYYRAAETGWISGGSVLKSHWFVTRIIVP